MNPHGTILFHIYGWHGSKGPSFLGSDDNHALAIEFAKLSLQKYTRVTVEDVRANVIVWDSAQRTS